MSEFIDFVLAEEPTAEQLKLVSELREKFSSMGLFMKVYDGRETSSRKSTLVVTFDQSLYDEHRSRGAGRREKLVKPNWRITAGEVRAKLADKSAEEVAAELGVSRSTLFRRLRDKDDSARF